MSLIDSASLIVTPNAYSEGKLYSVIPSDGSGDMSVTRATTATRVNSQGLVEIVANNIPRLDYSNGTCPSLLVEPQRTNLATYSSSFDNAVWTAQTISVTANATTAPDGTLTADTITPSGSVAFDNRVYETQSVTSGAVYTLSVWAKSSASNAKLTLALWNHGGQVFNITDQWERYSIAVTALSTEGNFNIYAGDVTPTTGAVNSSNVVTIWGAQLELGSYATSYIPTTSASVTRNADVISKTGISSLIGQTEGTIFWDINVDILSASGHEDILNIDNGAFGNTIYLAKLSNATFGAEVYNAGSAQCSFTNIPIPAVGRYKLALAYKTNDFSFYVNGVLVGSDTSGSVGAMSRIQLGQTVFGPSIGYTNAAALWKTRLTNDELERLTGMGFNTYTEMANYYNYITQ